MSGEQVQHKFTLYNYVKHFVQRSDITKGSKGFLDILTQHKKHPCGEKVKIVYKVGLFVYYLVHFLYPVIKFVIEGQYPVYNIVCGIISFIGVLYEVGKWIIPYSYRKIKQCKEKRQRTCQISPTNNMPADNESITVQDCEGDTLQDLNISQERTTADEIEFAVYAKKIFKEFVVDSLGEILIYPSIICSLYGFVNEKRWQFDSVFAVFDFFLLFYSLVMDAIYTKINYIWLLQKLIRSSYKAYDELESTQTSIWVKIFFFLTIPYGIMLVLTHWFMLAIIGVRIYADNFSREIDSNGNSTGEAETGDYKSAPYTCFMIFCGAYLPLASVVVYILLNKYWFLEIFWTIKDEDASAESKIKEMPTKVKLLACLVDPLAYIAIVFLMVPFIFFVVGTFLSDYQMSDFVLVSSARSAADALGAGFIILFVLSNIQAAIFFSIFIIILLIVIINKLLYYCDEESMRRQNQQNTSNS